MRSNPLVSVVIPVFNGTNFLAEAVDSVFGQTYSNLELIVVDDGSSDGTWDLIRSFGNRVHGIRKDNGGVATALNRGIESASGQYIAWLSHDDLFKPEKIELQVSLLDCVSDAAACYTDYSIIGPDRTVLRDITTPWFPRTEMLRILFGNMFVNGSTMVIRSDCFRQVGLFREDLRYTQDAEMWLRILRHWEIARVPEILGLQRTHPQQGSQDRGPHVEEECRMYSEAFDRLGVEVLFADRESTKDPVDRESQALVWFGDTMAFGRHWFSFADRQYRRALEARSSFGLPVRLRVALGARVLTAPHRWYRRFRHQLGTSRSALGLTR